MLNVHTNHAIVDKWFTPKECNQIINYAVNYGVYNKPRVGLDSQVPGGRVDESTRNGKLYFFTNKTIATKVLDKVKQVNKHLWNLKLYNLEPMQLTVYDVDDHYTWHRDQEEVAKMHPLHKDKPLIRKLSFSINLTQEGRDYSGGDLQTHDGLEFREKIPQIYDQGNGMVFLSALPHRVLPVTRGRRVALVGWVSGPPYR
jgi:predicted 2-oxoglutarate/Fe(II)-dependent dioxygenase YbiX